MAEKWVAVTGAGGYIGGQTVLKFKDMGYSVLGCDRSNTSSWIRDICDSYIPGDFTNAMFLHQILDLKPATIVHCAGTSLVGPSVTNPAVYYMNNVGQTARFMVQLAGIKWEGTFIFSGSAAVYGNPSESLLKENSPTLPISPYGHSKLMVEQLLRDCAKAYNINTISFRYFNASGADSQVRHGQLKQATHLIARVIESIINKDVFTLNGIDYDTHDGTCVRDYLHVEDIANAHYLGSLYGSGLDKGTSKEFNLGTGKGISIREIISSVEKITGEVPLIHTGPRREGDPATLVASAYSFTKTTKWKPEASGVDNIVKTAWDWYNSSLYQDRA
jgi:UDP-glucose 4-epimerase